MTNMMEISPIDTGNKLMHVDEFVTKMLMGGLDAENNTIAVQVASAELLSSTV